MPYPSTFHRLQVFGTGAGTEIWSFSLSLRMGLDAGAVSSGTNATATPDVAATAIPSGWPQLIQNFVGNACGKPAVLVGFKLNQLDTQGHYTQPTTNEYLYPGNGVVPSSTTAFPPQVSCAVTLDSGLRGPRRRGRFFIPYPNMGLTATTGQWADSSLQSRLTDAQALINGLNTSGGAHVVIASSAGAGGFALVKSIRIGSRPDVIRSRGGKIPEVYATQTV